MAIRVTDYNGDVDIYEDDGTASFDTEQVTNNLCITTTEKFVVYAEGKWTKAEQDNPHLDPVEGDEDYGPGTGEAQDR